MGLRRRRRGANADEFASLIEAAEARLELNQWLARGETVIADLRAIADDAEDAEVRDAALDRIAAVRARLDQADQHGRALDAAVAQGRG